MSDERNCENLNMEQKKQENISLDKVHLLKDGERFVNHNGGINTHYYEISKEEFLRITAMDNWRGLIREWADRDMPDFIRWGYGFYGCDLMMMDGKYFYSESIGSSCD